MHSRSKPGAYVAREDATAIGAVTATSIGAKYSRKPRTRQPNKPCKRYDMNGRYLGTVAGTRKVERTTVKSVTTEREERRLALLRKAGFIGNVE